MKASAELAYLFEFSVLEHGKPKITTGKQFWKGKRPLKSSTEVYHIPCSNTKQKRKDGFNEEHDEGCSNGRDRKDGLGNQANPGSQG